MSEQVRFERTDRGIVVSLIGEIDLANAYAIESEIRAGVGDEQRIAIDLSRTEYLDSAGARLLFSIARSVGDRMSIVVPEDSPLRRVLALVGLPNVVPVVSSLDAAPDDPAG